MIDNKLDSDFKSNVFRHILSLGKGSCPLMESMSLHPRDIVFDGRNGNCDINMGLGLSKALKLHLLPRTHDQQMSDMTPGDGMDPYDIFARLYEDLYSPKRNLRSPSDSQSQEYYENLCKAMSMKGLDFKFDRDKYA